MKKTILVGTVSILCACLLGCASKKIDLSQHLALDAKNTSIIIIKKVDYDAHGQPLFTSVLDKRPEKAGEQFTLVYLVDARPVKSFDIFVVDQELDLNQPRNVLYAWTGKGFEVGARVGLELGVRAAAEGKNGWVLLAVGAAMPVLGGFTGFTIGTWVIVPSAMEDIKKLLSPTETLISFREYSYDNLGRLTMIKMFQPAEKPAELVRTTFTYNEGRMTPSQTTIISYPENKTRTIPSFPKDIP